MYILIVFGYYNPMGFIPEFCPIKIIYSLGNWGIEDEEAIGYVELNAKSKKVMHFISLIKECKDLASTAGDASKFLRRSVTTAWDHGEEELSEWSERKGDDLYQLANFYEKGAFKFKRFLLKLIETSDQPLILHINWEDVVVLGPLFS